MGRSKGNTAESPHPAWMKTLQWLHRWSCFFLYSFSLNLYALALSRASEVNAISIELHAADRVGGSGCWLSHAPPSYLLVWQISGQLAQLGCFMASRPSLTPEDDGSGIAGQSYSTPGVNSKRNWLKIGGPGVLNCHNPPSPVVAICQSRLDPDMEP